MKECYISIDIEATGPTPGHYSMYQLGACVVGDTEQQFSCDIALLSKTSYNQATLTAMHIESVDVLLKRKGVLRPKHAMHAFAKWVFEVAGDAKPVFVANNAPFDWMFVAWYFKETGVNNPFGHAALDMKAYFMGKAGASWKRSTLGQMAEYGGVPFTALPHDALKDAIIQAEIFSALLKRKGGYYENP